MSSRVIPVDSTLDLEAGKPDGTSSRGANALAELVTKIVCDSESVVREYIDISPVVTSVLLSEKCENFSRTPLIWAAHNGDKAMVTFLLEQGADMNGIDCKGKSAYAFAIEKGHIKLLHMLHQPAPIREMRRPSPLPELKNITPPTTSTTKIRLERRIGFGQYEKHEQKYAQQKLNQRAQRNSLNIERCCSPAVSPWDSGDF